MKNQPLFKAAFSGWPGQDFLSVSNKNSSVFYYTVFSPVCKGKSSLKDLVFKKPFPPRLQKVLNVHNSYLEKSLKALYYNTLEQVLRDSPKLDLGVDFLANYTGANCPVCGKRFTENDDIVVCPICGAPHHRACYQQLGHCALEELHIKGHAWSAGPQPSQDTSNGAYTYGSSQQDAHGTTCPACGAHNPAGGLFCQICGAPLRSRSGPFEQKTSWGYGDPRAAASSAYASAFGGVSPEEEIEGVSARDIAMFIGSNSRYFLPRFKQYTFGKGFFPSLPAFFFGSFYFFYRKMYLVGSCLLGLFLLSQLPTLFALPEYMAYILENMDLILKGINPAPFVPSTHLWVYAVMPYIRMVSFAIALTISFFANRLYMSYVLRRVRRLKTVFTRPDGQVDDMQYTAALTRKGGTNRIAVVCLAVGLLLLFIIVGQVMGAVVLNSLQ